MLIPRGSALRATLLRAAMDLAAQFDGEFGNGWQSYAGSGTLRYAW
jgi:hypothetical protein